MPNVDTPRKSSATLRITPTDHPYYPSTTENFLRTHLGLPTSSIPKSVEYALSNNPLAWLKGKLTTIKGMSTQIQPAGNPTIPSTPSNKQPTTTGHQQTPLADMSLRMTVAGLETGENESDSSASDDDSELLPVTTQGNLIMVRDLPVQKGIELENLILQNIELIKNSEDNAMDPIRTTPFNVAVHGEKGSKEHLTNSVYILLGRNYTGGPDQATTILAKLILLLRAEPFAYNASWAETEVGKDRRTRLELTGFPDKTSFNKELADTILARAQKDGWKVYGSFKTTKSIFVSCDTVDEAKRLTNPKSPVGMQDVRLTTPSSRNTSVPRAKSFNLRAREPKLQYPIRYPGQVTLIARELDIFNMKVVIGRIKYEVKQLIPHIPGMKRVYEFSEFDLAPDAYHLGPPTWEIATILLSDDLLERVKRSLPANIAERLP